MKICFIISTLSKGGAERVLSVLASFLAQNHEICILKFDKNEPFYEVSSKVKIFSTESGVGEKGFFGNIFKRFSKIFAVRKFLKNGDFDAVVSFLDYVNILVILANFGLGRKLIISEHTNHTFLKSPVLRVLKRILYPFASGLAVLSQFDKNFYTFAKKIEIIQNPFFGDISAKNFSKENLIISAGRLQNFKGFDTFLRALTKIEPQILKKWQIIIAGDGPERKNLEQQARNLGLNVKFLGFIKDIEKIYEKAKIVAVTSRAEGFCNILMESIYFGVVRISTDCIAGPSELIKDRIDGFLCEVDNEKQIAEKIEILMTDENLRAEFVKNADLRRENFSVETIAKKWINFIKECE